MKFFNLVPVIGSKYTTCSFNCSIRSLLTPFALTLTLLASFPSISSQVQRINFEEPTTIHPGSTATQFDPQKQLTQYQNKEAYLQLWMQFELLRPRLKSPNNQNPASEINDFRTTHEGDNAQEFLVF